jgi:enoyl-[acyl-carrier protein] reductase II
MTYLGSAELAAAVSNADGLGIIGSGSYPPEWLKEQIELIRWLTNEPFGVNIMLMSPFVDEIVKVIIEEKVSIVTIGGGNSETYLPRLKEAGVRTLPVISNVALAKRLANLGATALIAEGMEAGGHIGETTTFSLIPQLISAVNIPVIAAGGIADGYGLASALTLGAHGVQMGTRFICAEECPAHPNFKQKILTADDQATTIIGQTIGHPIRCLKNRLTQQYLAMEKRGATGEELGQLIQGKLYLGLIEGDLENGLLMCGQIAGAVKEIKPAAMIIEEMVAQAEAIISASRLCPEGLKPEGSKSNGDSSLRSE